MHQIGDFLKRHPSEFVIMGIKGDSDDAHPYYTRVMNAYINAFNNYMIKIGAKGKVIRNMDPLDMNIGELRGNLLILNTNQNGYVKDTATINTYGENGKHYVEREIGKVKYKLSNNDSASQSDKIDDILSMYGASNPDDWNIAFLSTHNSGDSLLERAEDASIRFTNHLWKIGPSKIGYSNRNMGWFYVDFLGFGATPNLANAIYAHNFIISEEAKKAEAEKQKINKEEIIKSAFEKGSYSLKLYRISLDRPLDFSKIYVKLENNNIPLNDFNPKQTHSWGGDSIYLITLPKGSSIIEQENQNFFTEKI